MRALFWNGTKAAITDSRPIPTLREDYILVKVIAVALNPTDHKAIQQGRASKNGLLGCDFAGVVEEVGQRVTKPLRKGDRICGCVHGANFNNLEDGAFAEWIVAKGDTCIRISDSMSFEEACTVPVSAITCGQGLFQRMQLHLPNEPVKDNPFLLIHGGSTSAGTLAIQYATLAGYKVLATCSPKNADLCKSLGAQAVFDYHEPKCGQVIHEYTKNELFFVWDTVGSEEGVKISMDALSSKPGTKYGTMLFNSIPRQDVAYSSSFLMTFLGEAFDKFGKHMPASAEDFDFAKRFTQLTEQLLATGQLQPHPVKMLEHGLQSILDEGLPLMSEGRVSGVKLICRVADV